MKPYATFQASKETLDLFENIKKIFAKFSELKLADEEKGKKILASSHIMTRALAKFFSIDYKEGHFGLFYDHSWLTPEHNVIIDPYPVGLTGGSVLLVNESTRPGSSLYEEASIEGLDTSSFLKDRDEATEVIREIAKQLGI